VEKYSLSLIGYTPQRDILPLGSVSSLGSISSLGVYLIFGGASLILEYNSYFEVHPFFGVYLFGSKAF
jgi:hypothetical protein